MLIEQKETIAAQAPPVTQEPDLANAVQDVIRDVLKPVTKKIDLEGYYPVEVLRALGEAGAFRQHLGSQNGKGEPDINAALLAMDLVSRECMSTGFMVWAQDVLGWYIELSENDYLKQEILPRVASGEILGGTALSNPMKYFSGIEPLHLSATEDEEGFLVSGTLPWVSNLGPDHWFGAIFHVEGENPRDVMALVPCDSEHLELKQLAKFTGMEGTGTYALHFDQVRVPRRHVVGDPIKPYLHRMKAGFILMQTGMATGVIDSCITLCEQAALRLDHVNCYLDDQPDEMREELGDVRETIEMLAQTPFESDPGYLRAVLEARLLGSESVLKAANAAMLHTGAAG
ncbi:MAG: acyl-CoA dehydrogenase family protein, partial [Halothiobacillaceae bacterium]